jgi:hypothetical protein
VSAKASSTFISNMSLPVHRWFRYSAGFSAEWVASVISEAGRSGPVRVFDPFAGSATTLLAAETAGVESWGIDAHPFVARIARAKLAWRSDPVLYQKQVERVLQTSSTLTPDTSEYPPLLHTCYDPESLAALDLLRRSYELTRDDTSASELVWLTIVGILRRVSRVGTAPWQYLLPKRKKSNPQAVLVAFNEFASMVYHDMQSGQGLRGPQARFSQIDARTCEGVASHFANLVVTSPPYPNNYDYADATRLEMTFMGELRGWGELQEKVRKYLIRSCSQHVPEKAINLEEVLASQELDPIRSEISTVCRQLAEIRESKGGRKTYHLMIACYFRDMAQVWTALRDACDSPSTVCFVIGDSAPYGIYVPTIPWLGKLATAAGFSPFAFEKTRDRNIKWKNRKHRVPLQEGRLWIKG